MPAVPRFFLQDAVALDRIMAGMVRGGGSEEQHLHAAGLFAGQFERL